MAVISISELLKIFADTFSTLSSNSSFNGVTATNNSVQAITNKIDMAPLKAEIISLGNYIETLSNTGTVTTVNGLLSGSGSYVYNVVSGVNIIDIATGDNDFNLNNYDEFRIDGATDSIVIFRLEGENNMISQDVNIINNTGGEHNVMFFTNQEENDEHFNLSGSNNAMTVGCVAFWSTGSIGDAATISYNNVDGSSQIVADQVILQDVNLTTCVFQPVPEPMTMSLLAAGGLFAARKRRKA